MEALTILEYMFFILMSIASILLITFLVLGIFLVVQIRRYLRRVAEGVERVASNFDGHLVEAIKGLLKYPLIGFVLRRVFKKFF